MKAQIIVSSPLRQRMIDDMRMRKLAPKTQQQYVRVVRQFAGFLGRPPDTASTEDLRRYQLYLVDQGTSPISLNAAITGLQFFFDVTANHPELMAKMRPVRVPRTLPVILSREEVSRLIIGAGNLKHQTALALAYATGLRASEVVALKVGDIDSERMTAARGTGQGPERPLRHAGAGIARTPARVVARCTCARQDARRRLAVSRARSHQSAQHPSAQPGHPCGRPRSTDRQACLDAYPAPQFRYPSAGTEG